MHGLNSVNGSEEDVSLREFSDESAVSGMAEKTTVDVDVGRCCDGDDGTKPWMGSAHENMANRKVVTAFAMMLLGLFVTMVSGPGFV